MINSETICAVSTPPGSGGIAVVRISGENALPIVEKLWRGRSLSSVETHTVHLGNILDTNGRILDQAVATVYKGPNSFTGEDVVELSVHGSIYIQQTLLQTLVDAGARLALPGEFTQRAFLNGKMDLAQAEAVADIIASSSKAAHSLAISQINGGFSNHINSLREKLIEIAALLELELDFSEEDVEFADRSKLYDLALEIISTVHDLSTTFSAGNAMKEGIPVAIIGRPNSGKSSLLNVLVGVDRSIVTDIPGTTRDTIEASADINGITFRFIDTAGLRHTDDPVESLGIERARASLTRARVILWLVDPDLTTDEAFEIFDLIEKYSLHDAKIIVLFSKADLEREYVRTPFFLSADPLKISVRTGQGIPELHQRLYKEATLGLPSDESMIVTNARHYEALKKAEKALNEMLDGMDNKPNSVPLTTDLLAEHLRESIDALATITGQISSENILHTIFSRFCIGK